MAYASYWLMPEKLSVTAYGGLFRCFNFGHNYTHCYTSYFATGALNAYLGNLSSMPTPTTALASWKGKPKAIAEATSP